MEPPCINIQELHNHWISFFDFLKTWTEFLIFKVDGNDDTANILEEDELANEHAVTSPTASGDAQEEEAFDLGGTMIIQVHIMQKYH